MDVREAGQPRDLLVQPRIVLHRARAEREQAEIDRVILAAEARVVADGFRLRQAGKADRAGAEERSNSLPFTGGVGGGACILLRAGLTCPTPTPPLKGRG